MGDICTIQNDECKDSNECDGDLNSVPFPSLYGSVKSCNVPFDGVKSNINVNTSKLQKSTPKCFGKVQFNPPFNEPKFDYIGITDSTNNEHCCLVKDNINVYSGIDTNDTKLFQSCTPIPVGATTDNQLPLDTTKTLNCSRTENDVCITKIKDLYVTSVNDLRSNPTPKCAQPEFGELCTISSTCAAQDIQKCSSD